MVIILLLCVKTLKLDPLSLSVCKARQNIVSSVCLQARQNILSAMSTTTMRRQGARGPGRDRSNDHALPESNRPKFTKPKNSIPGRVILAMMAGSWCMSMLLVCAISLALTGTYLFGIDHQIATGNIFKPRVDFSPANPKVFTAEELAKYDGSTYGLPLLLAFNGKVYDVSDGAEHYGPAGAYRIFAGRDATRAFLTGDFENDLNGDISDLGPREEVEKWAKFYEEHETYKCVGTMA